MHEIGRLRERTFRQIGEGTGRSCDIDRFDVDYEHICLWNEKTREIVGSPRRRRAFTFGRMKRRIASDPEICPSKIEEVDEILHARPTSTASVPVLLKRYLDLGGRIVGLNVDREFGDAVDALLVVDLSKTDPAILERLFGQKETDRYLARHRTFSTSMQS